MSMMTDEKRPEPRPLPAGIQPRKITSTELLQGKNELWIEHAGQLYRLRVTRSGKLILQK
jgi:hemin uptake protein HemP